MSKVHAGATVGPARAGKINSYLDCKPRNSTPMDELLYAQKIVSPAQQPPVPDSPALVQILARLGDIKTFVEHKGEKAPAAYQSNATNEGAQATLDKELGE